MACRHLHGSGPSKSTTAGVIHLWSIMKKKLYMLESSLHPVGIQIYCVPSKHTIVSQNPRHSDMKIKYLSSSRIGSRNPDFPDPRPMQFLPQREYNRQPSRLSLMAFSEQGKPSRAALAPGTGSQKRTWQPSHKIREHSAFISLTHQHFNTLKRELSGEQNYGTTVLSLRACDHNGYLKLLDFASQFSTETCDSNLSWGLFSAQINRNRASLAHFCPLHQKCSCCSYTKLHILNRG